MNRSPFIVDTTLRDGEQTPGLAFSLHQKVEIARKLDDLGIDEVEAGTPAIGREEQEAIRVIASSGFSFTTSSWCRAISEDIVQAAALGTQSVNISLPVSDIQIETLGKNRRWVLHQLASVTRQASNLFPWVTMGAQDASRANPEFLNEFIYYAIESGAQRLRINDTVGIMDPFETSELFARLKALFPSAEFEFHGHNDLGLATANALAALAGGAGCISATVNGIGERAGNSCLEEIIGILHHKQGENRFNTRMINPLAQYVARASGMAIHATKPFTGPNAFRHESGIHVSAMLKNPSSYQLLDPAEYGCSPISYMEGKHSGKKKICHKARQ